MMNLERSSVYAVLAAVAVNLYVAFEESSVRALEAEYGRDRVETVVQSESNPEFVRQTAEANRSRLAVQEWDVKTCQFLRSWQGFARYQGYVARRAFATGQYPLPFVSALRGQISVCDDLARRGLLQDWEYHEEERLDLARRESGRVVLYVREQLGLADPALEPLERTRRLIVRLQERGGQDRETATYLAMERPATGMAFFRGVYGQLRWLNDPAQVLAVSQGAPSPEPSLLPPDPCPTLVKITAPERVEVRRQVRILAVFRPWLFAAARLYRRAFPFVAGALALYLAVRVLRALGLFRPRQPPRFTDPGKGVYRAGS